MDSRFRGNDDYVVPQFVGCDDYAVSPFVGMTIMRCLASWGVAIMWTLVLALAGAHVGEEDYLADGAAAGE